MNKVTLMFPGFRTKAFTMSFDDGIDTDIRMASIMKKYGVKGTFNLNSGLFSPEGTVKPEGRDAIPLTVSQAKELTVPAITRSVTSAARTRFSIS